jgi:RNA polymerase sigma-70 factor (ECF subfamily)
MPVELEAAEFLRDFLLKDKKAVDAFFDAYWGRIYGFAYQLSKDEAEAEDIAIKGFTVLFTSERVFSTLDQVRAFLYVTVRNASFNYLKSRERLTQRQQRYVALVEEDKDLENAQLEGEVMEALYAAVNQLPEDWAVVLRLLYFEGLKYQEVADSLGLSMDAVKARRRAGVNRLREFMSDRQLVAVMAICLSTADVYLRK